MRFMDAELPRRLIVRAVADQLLRFVKGNENV